MFPFPITKPKFQYPFGVKVLADGRPLLLQNPGFEKERLLKQELLKANRSLYYQMLPEAEQAAKECTDLLCQTTPWLAPAAESDSRANKDAGLDSNETRSLAETPDLSSQSDPLLWLGHQVQEDLILIDGDPDGEQALIGGVVCFPSGWSIQEKIGLSMSEIHQPVPTFEQKLMKPTAKLLGTLKTDRPVWRVNWGLRPSALLDQSPQYFPLMDRLAREITAETAGESCFFRLEYQTLSRLPQSGHILFTIHTVQTKLHDLQTEEKKLLLSNLETCPEAILKYKGIWDMKKAVCDYLKDQTG